MEADKSKNYKKQKKLGAGSFGTVYLVKNKNKEFYVMKELKVSSDNPLEDIKREGEMMKLLNSRFVIKFIDGFPSKSDVYNLVMEFCDGGDLEEVIKKARFKGASIPEDDIIKYFIEMALGVGYIHKSDMIHRDLKPANIFLTEDKEGNKKGGKGSSLVVKIGDLGLTKICGQSGYRVTFCGTILYMAPEIIMQQPYNNKVDVWALGIILYELMQKVPPFIDNSPVVLYQKIMSGDYPQITANYSESLKQIVAQMLKVDAKDRPEIKEVLSNNFLISKSKELGLFEELSTFVGLSIGGKVSLHSEFTFMQKYLVEEVGLDKSYFDPRLDNPEGSWNKNVSEISGFQFYPPHGWYAIGLNIEKLYPSAMNDLSWISGTEEYPIGTWPMAYHGLRPGFIPIKQKIYGIITEGLKAGPNQEQAGEEDELHPGQCCGNGVYHYYNIQSMIYNQNVVPDEFDFMFIFQCRVNPENIRQPKNHKEIWVLTGSKANTRPFRLLFRRVPKNNFSQKE